MLSPKPLKNIQARFIFVTTAILAAVCLFILSLAIWFSHHNHQIEINKVLTEQTLSALASHTQERKQQDYLNLQRIIPHGDWVESVALYDKSCNLLTTTFLPTFPISRCPQTDKRTIRIQYTDVLSPIGTIVLKLNEKALKPQQMLLWLPIVFAVFLLIGILISVCWKLFIYRPLTREIGHLADGDVTSIDELGPLGEKISSMLTKVKSHELQKERLASAEQKFQNALKVAHDILAPLQVLMNEQTNSLQSAKSKQALLQIEGIALDLLPEKAPITLSPASISDLLTQAITNARVTFEDSPLPIIVGPHHLSVNVSVIHFVRALTNLLKNSFEVQPPDLPLIIRIERNSSLMALLTIHDNGPGMPAHPSETTKAQGSGLGIKSAQDAIVKMGGKLTFDSNSSGTITQVSLPLIKKTVYLSPNEEIYRFGFEANNNHFDLNLINSNKRSLILSPFERLTQLPANLRWIQTLSPDEVELKELKSALLIEDDKYIRAHWIQEARKAGIELHATAEIPLEIKQTDIIFLDRYLGNIDSMSWENEASKKGHQVMMISAERGTGSKTPPWLLS